MLLFLGTHQAWSVFVRPLREAHGFSAFQMQLIFNTGTFTFCTMIIIAGRLHDRFGPRPLAAASAVLLGLAWSLAWAFSDSYVFLWLAIGVLATTGSATGYVCPLATALKWFPNKRGMVSGVTAAWFAAGPVLLSWIAETLMRGGWEPRRIFGLVAVVYAPAVLVTGMVLVLPPGQPTHHDVTTFRRRSLLRDRRFWTLFAGMFVGTLPFLIIMGNAKPLALDFGLAPAVAAIAITVLAVGNAVGRIFWGFVIDRIGPRRSMLTAQMIVIVSIIALIALGSLSPITFFVSVFGVGFCYGSNFAIYPATVTKLYGAHVLGSVYPFIMGAQAISSFGPGLNGFLKDTTGSNYPGLVFALIVAVVGCLACVVLSRALDRKTTGDAVP